MAFPFINASHKRQRSTSDDMEDSDHSIAATSAHNSKRHATDLHPEHLYLRNVVSRSGNSDNGGDGVYVSAEAASVQAELLRLSMNTPRHADGSTSASDHFAAMQHPLHLRPAAPSALASYGSTAAVPLFAAWEVSVKVLVPASASRSGRKEDLLLAWVVLDSSTAYAWATGLHAWADVGAAAGGVYTDDAILRAVQRHALALARSSASRCVPSTVTTGSHPLSVPVPGPGHGVVTRPPPPPPLVSPLPAEVLTTESRASKEFWWRVRAQYASALHLSLAPATTGGGVTGGQGGVGGEVAGTRLGTATAHRRALTAAGMDARWACGRDEGESAAAVAVAPARGHAARPPPPPPRRPAGAMSIEGDDSFSSSSSSSSSSGAASALAVQPQKAEDDMQDPFPTPPGVHLSAASASAPPLSLSMSAPFPTTGTGTGTGMGVGSGAQTHIAPLASAWTAVSAATQAAALPYPSPSVVHLPARAWQSLCDAWNVAASTSSAGAGGLTSPATRLHAYLQAKGGLSS